MQQIKTYRIVLKKEPEEDTLLQYLHYQDV